MLPFILWLELICISILIIVKVECKNLICLCVCQSLSPSPVGENNHFFFSAGEKNTSFSGDVMLTTEHEFLQN